MEKLKRAIARIGGTAGQGAFMGVLVAIFWPYYLGSAFVPFAINMALLIGIPALVVAIILQLMDAVGKPLNHWQSGLAGGIVFLVLAYLKVGHAGDMTVSIGLFGLGAGIGWFNYQIGWSQRSWVRWGRAWVYVGVQS